MTELIAKKRNGSFNKKNEKKAWDSIEQRITARFGAIIPIDHSKPVEKFPVACIVCYCESDPEKPIRFLVDASTRAIFVMDDNAEIEETL